MSELKHYGIPGQKWGIRRWQNPDGSFNEEGKKRYGRIGNGIRNANKKRLTNAYNASLRDAEDLRKHGFKEEARAVQKVADNLKDYLNNYEKSGNILTENQKKVFKIGAIVTTAAIAGYGVYRVSKLKGSTSVSNTLDELGPKIVNKKTGEVLSDSQAQKVADEAMQRFEEKKTQAESDIIDRHKEAAQVISKMVNDIQSGKITGPESEQHSKNMQKLDEINRKLNDSIDKAREVGVPESKIIHNLGESDNYFTGAKKITKYELDPEKYNPISIYTREHGNIGATGYRLPENENKLLQMISKITYPTNSSAYEEAVIRAAKRTGNTIYDAKNVARKYQKAVESSQESPSKGELNFYATTASIKSGLDNIQRMIDKEWPKN